MGYASRNRGTFEERKAQAIARAEAQKREEPPQKHSRVSSPFLVAVLAAAGIIGKKETK